MKFFPFFPFNQCMNNTAHENSLLSVRYCLKSEHELSKTQKCLARMWRMEFFKVLNITSMKCNHDIRRISKTLCRQLVLSGKITNGARTTCFPSLRTSYPFSNRVYHSWTLSWYRHHRNILISSIETFRLKGCSSFKQILISSRSSLLFLEQTRQPYSHFRFKPCQVWPNFIPFFEPLHSMRIVRTNIRNKMSVSRMMEWKSLLIPEAKNCGQSMMYFFVL